MSQKRNDEIMSRGLKIALVLVAVMCMAIAAPVSAASTQFERYTFLLSNYQGDVYINDSISLMPNSTVCAQFDSGTPTAGYPYQLMYRQSDINIYNYTNLWGTFPTSNNATALGSAGYGDVFNVSTYPYGNDGKWIGHVAVCNPWGDYVTGYYWTMRNATRPATNVTFIAHETGNISQRIEGASISIVGTPGSYSGSTDSSGMYNITLPPASDYSYIAEKYSYANVTGLLGTIGQTGGVVYVPMSPVLLANASIYLYITDAKTGNFISNSQYGIQNLTSGVWKNGTAASGQVGFASTDGEPGYPIAVGQTLRLAAGAEWYFPDSALITVPAYPVPYIHTIPLVDNRTFYNGTWSLIVTLRDATYTSTPITDATVMIYTGVNTNVPFTATEDSGGTGVYSFVNISASALGRLTASAEGYRDTEEIINIVWNSTQHKTLYMQRIGVLPNTTPTTSPTGGPVTTTTTSTIPTTYTNSTAASNDALNVIWSYLVTFATIGCAIVFAWLFWIFIYEFTGGDVINKLLRRGRGGGRRR